MGTKLAIVFLIGGGQLRKIQQERGNQARWNLRRFVQKKTWCTNVTTQVVYCWPGVLFGAPRRGNLLVAQGRAKRRPGYCRPFPAFALQGQKHKSPRLLFVHTLNLLYMLLPLQGESAAHCIHHPGRRFALPWATSRLPLRGAQTASFHPQLVPCQTGFSGKKRPE